MTALVVAVDLDDTCADRLGVIAGRLLAEGVDVGRRRPGRWDLTDWGIRDQAHYDRLHHDAFVRSPGYCTMAPLPGAVRGIRSLRDAGFRIRIMTGRLWTSQVLVTALGDTARWLVENGIPADDVVFVSDKTAVLADVYVEDAPHFISDLRAAGRRVVVMDAGYNRHLRGPRAMSWGEVPALVAGLLDRDSARPVGRSG